MANGYRRRHSVSAIGLFHDCPQAYSFRYIDRVPTDRTQVGEPLRIGTAVHAGLEAAAIGLKLDGLTLEGPEILAVADQGLEESWIDQGLPVNDGRLDECKGWMREAIAEWDKDGKIVSIEWEIRQDLPDGSGFIGFADRIDRLNEDTVEIRDYKNTRKVTDPEYLANDLQVNMYAHFARETWPWARNVVASHQHPNHGGKVVKVNLTDDSINEAVDRFLATIEMIESEVEWSTRISQRCDWCDYKDICPAWTAPQPDEVEEDPDAAAIKDIIDNY
jgi:RecB family exonuclease